MAHTDPKQATEIVDIQFCMNNYDHLDDLMEIRDLTNDIERNDIKSRKKVKTKKKVKKDYSDNQKELLEDVGELISEY